MLPHALKKQIENGERGNRDWDFNKRYDYALQIEWSNFSELFC